MAIAKPIRVEILGYLVQYESGSPSKIAREIGEPVRRVSDHMQRLERYGLVELARIEPTPRGSPEHIYRLIARPEIKDGTAFLDLDSDAQSSFVWEIYRLTSIDFVRAISSGSFDNRLDWHLTQFPMDADEEGKAEVVDALNRALEELYAIEGRCKQRLAKGDEKPIRLSASLLGFELPPR
jgi:predicted ArsR family transcriptional regulator